MFREIIFGIAFSIAFPFIFSGFIQLSKRLLPYRAPPGQRQWSLSQLERLFKRCDTAMTLFWLVGTHLFAGLWLAVLVILEAAIQPEPGDRGILVNTSLLFSGSICLVGGLLTCYAVRPVWLAMLLKQRAPLYTLYTKLRYGPILLAISKVLLSLMAIFITVSAYFMRTTYAFFGPDKIRFNYAFRAAATYQYSEIAEIRGKQEVREKDGELRAWYEIEFHDRIVWSDVTTLRLYDVCESHKVAAFAAVRSGRPIVGPDLSLENGCSPGP